MNIQLSFSCIIYFSLNKAVFGSLSFRRALTEISSPSPCGSETHQQMLKNNRSSTVLLQGDIETHIHIFDEFSVFDLSAFFLFIFTVKK